MNAFEKKFGVEFLETVPSAPGVYLAYGASGEVVYVGKAKDLRKRLAQYRNARRGKRHRKMRDVVKHAVKISWEVTESESEALLREIRLIQSLRPALNVAGAFNFLYPLVGIKRTKAALVFCMTTHPDAFPEFDFYGAFRSRDLTGEAFFALMELMRYVGHRSLPKLRKGEVQPEHSYVFEFRRLPEEWPQLWSDFFKGLCADALEQLTWRLLQNAGARARAAEVQEGIDALERFWKNEAKALAEAIAATNFPHYPVAQEDRDPLFISFRTKDL